jgi:hypothetical protein
MVILYSMKRPTFVRPLSDAERKILEAGLHSPEAFTLRRCQILIASDRGNYAYQNAHQLGCNPQTAHNAIHAFNEKGLPEALRESGEGVRIMSCLLPKQSPWLNAIEPKWIHGKRKVVESDGLVGAYELAERVCRVFGCPHYEHLSIPQEGLLCTTSHRNFGEKAIYEGEIVLYTALIAERVEDVR